ncbi:hypothetical protein [Azovibrio restrictus]|uniref:hypothetical protein n=1 Tax=Azovibrio restrictus TaxID=146938 RepID=UPI00040612E1|nr:hypothetical protein [Azovibrio restrictus]MCE1171070.1 hypothetical protein [Azovibrio sp.]
MTYHIIVSFAKDRAYEFKSASGEVSVTTQEEARRWLDKEFADLKCEITSPTGKILIIDKLLAVARTVGESRFSQENEWARQYARNVALTLGRDLVRVDVEHMRLGY